MRQMIQHDRVGATLREFWGHNTELFTRLNAAQTYSDILPYELADKSVTITKGASYHQDD